MKGVKRLMVCMAALVFLCLSGCGEAYSSAEDMQETAQEDQKEELSGSITIWEHDYSFEESLVAVIEGFCELYPNVEVNYQIRADGDYDSVLKTAIQSGAGPDLFWSNGTSTATFLELVESGACLELTSLVDFSFIEENSDRALKLGTVEDEIYSTQWLTLDTDICYYNRDLFEDNGWEVPTTFSEFEQLLSDIYETGITPVSMALDAWCLVFAYQPILAAYDPEYCEELTDYQASVTADSAVEAMEKMVEWSEDGYFGESWFNVEESNEQLYQFTSGTAAMVITGSWNTTTISKNNPDMNFGAFAIPSEAGEVGLVGAVANGFSINANSDNPDAAIAFADYCATEEAQTLWVQMQGAISATENIEASTDIGREIAQSSNGIVYIGWEHIVNDLSSTGNAADVFLEDFTKVFTGEMSVDELMGEIEAEM